MIYEFGIMSNVWEMNAENDKIAKIAMCLFISRDIPIAIYVPKEEVIWPMNILEDNKNNISKQEALLLQSAIKSIKHIRG